jgi:hypothetical protein
MLALVQNCLERLGDRQQAQLNMGLLVSIIILKAVTINYCKNIRFSIYSLISLRKVLYFISATSLRDYDIRQGFNFY